MKIAFIIPGSGPSFYCENCMRDANLIQGLRNFNIETTVVPMYLPPSFGDGILQGDTRVFFGAVSVYLGHKIPFLTKLPGAGRILNSRAFLKYAAKKAGATRSAGLGEITISMLLGEEGLEAGELYRLVKELRDEIKPDLVHISNALLIGLAGSVKKGLNAPVVCTLQDEDTWIEQMDESHKEQAWQLMTEKAADVDAFLPVSKYYSEFMRTRMGIPSNRLHVVYPGVPIDKFESRSVSFDPPVLGYLSRMTETSGLGRLVDAFIRLKEDPGFQKLKLRAAGGLTGDDSKFMKRLKKKLKDHGMIDDAEFYCDYSMQSYSKLLSGVSVLSVPDDRGAAFGLYIIESLASGIPVVQPEAGAFPEIIDMTGGGLIYKHGDVDSLVHSLAALLGDSNRARKLGKLGRKSIEKYFTSESAASRTVDVYRRAAGIS
jgi:glycosyltransferase involved in cell wall biosynthesis